MATLVDERNNVPSPTHPDEFLGDNAGMISSGPWCHGTFLLFFCVFFAFLIGSLFGCFFSLGLVMLFNLNVISSPLQFTSIF